MKFFRLLPSVALFSITIATLFSASAQSKEIISVSDNGKAFTCLLVAGQYEVGLIDSRKGFLLAADQILKIERELKKLKKSTTRRSSRNVRKIAKYRTLRRLWKILFRDGAAVCRGTPTIVSQPTSDISNPSTPTSTPTITASSTPTVTPTSTSTPIRSCTPPPCSAPNRLVCPSQSSCPGGCGVVCTAPPTATATRTPTATATATRTSTPVVSPTPDPLAKTTEALTESKVRYLYRKVGLGAVSDEVIQVGVTEGLSALITKHLARYDNQEIDVLVKCANLLPIPQNNQAINRSTIQKWALCHLIESKNPFFDRMTFLFLHNLLAVSATGLLDSQMQNMRDQLELIRAHSLSGNYRELVKVHARQEATLQYLALAFSTALQPNEDYARELMQLYTLGEFDPLTLTKATPTRNYNENDVAMVALAIAGHGLQRVGAGANQTWTAIIKPNDVYKGAVTIFAGSKCEKTFPPGNSPKDIEIIDHIFACLPVENFMAYRIVNEYMTEDMRPLLDDGKFLSAFARRIRQLNFNYRLAIIELIQMEEFWKPAYRNSIVTTPVEMVVNMIRQLKIPYEAINYDTLRNRLDAASHAITTLPSVFGNDNLDFADATRQLQLTNAIRSVLGTANGATVTEGTTTRVVWKCTDVLPQTTTSLGSTAVANHLVRILHTPIGSAGRAELVKYLDSQPSINAQGNLVVTVRPFDSKNAAHMNTLCGAIEMLVSRNFSR